MWQPKERLKVKTKKCSTCKEEKLLEDFYKQGNRLMASCRECIKIRTKKWAANHIKENKAAKKKYLELNVEKRKDAVRKYNLRPEAKYRRCKSRHIKKFPNQPLLTLSEYKSIISNKCFYCDSDLPLIGTGVDRVDSSIGYISGNVVACCTICNFIKSNTTLEELKIRLPKILKKIEFLTERNNK